MSSVLTTTHQRAFAQATEKAVPCQEHLEALQQKRQRLMRSGSIQKIKQFNTYICSQNYFILPALIVWLKTSQTALHSHIENCISILKTIFFASLLHQVFVSNAKACAALLNAQVRGFVEDVRTSDAIPALEMLAFIVHHSVSSLLESVRRKLFVLCVYATLALIFLQLATVIFFLCNVYLPGGLIFMVACLSFISHIIVKVVFHYLRKEEDRYLHELAERRPKTFVLGKKTISNFDLF